MSAGATDRFLTAYKGTWYPITTLIIVLRRSTVASFPDQACTLPIILFQHRPSICRDFNLVVAPTAVKVAFLFLFSFFVPRQERRRKSTGTCSPRGCGLLHVSPREHSTVLLPPTLRRMTTTCKYVFQASHRKTSQDGPLRKRNVQVLVPACLIRFFQIHEVNRRHISVLQCKDRSVQDAFRTVISLMSSPPAI
ncbi:uncharacterized protein EV420DRAFT_1200997 [Desarmillaria tabescens]|uniref:Uncharacterized protein n=1 Tax=Armillaria tabescens TaxID=1929756 RepID=A0AA39NBU0_ARMTA|nr:uncharacterized protein EV420DRAFT_1200997 [Desarmillaria tabescens]KAK0462638.1 hypothetical protein EV420DRAFT_1200997 [Desarmillaria tabescens]